MTPVGAMGAGEIPPPGCHGRAALLKSRNANRHEFVLGRKYLGGGAEPARGQECRDAGKTMPSPNYLLSTRQSEVLINQQLDSSDQSNCI